MADIPAYITQGKIKHFLQDFLPFSAELRRNFPWRHKQTAYRVLVSELMLQQTQVSRVIEKYEPFLAKFPSLAAVRSASLQELLLEWKGLGYMRRIKSLQQIAGTVANLPKTHSELCKLPGIGEYTGGAVLAFSHDIFVPILETNIRTVLCYHFCARGEFSCLAEKQYKEMLPILFTESGLSAKAFYEAMMDYGTYLKKEKKDVCSFKYKQKPFKGSSRELRAKILFAVTEGKEIERKDSRTEGVLGELVREGFIVKTTTGYEIAL